MRIGRSASGRTRSLWPVAVVACIAVAAVASAAPELRIEAEDYEAYGSHNIGGWDIASVYCGGASGWFAVDGLDVPGEWIMLKVTFTESACFNTRLDYQASYEDTVQLVVRMLDFPAPGEELLADYSLSEGWGFG
jgi:hypothetical protein